MRPSISPLEIRKREFAARFRGYDKAEVAQFLEALAEDLEEIFRSLDELERQNARLTEENVRHRDTESTLQQTLVMAQKSADGVRNNAEKEAELVVAEAESKAERLMHQAIERMAETEKKIRELRVERKNFQLKLQGMIDLFQQVLNFDKEEEDLENSVSIHRPTRRREGDAG
jgi:cell division initiation protein